MSTVLLVEDEMNLAMMMEEVLAEKGYTILKAARLPQALAFATSNHIDAAVLDVNLDGVAVFPLATELRNRGVPFAFASGYGAEGIPAEYQNYPILSKPYLAEQLLQEIATLLTH